MTSRSASPMRGSEDTHPITCRLVGGPHDGADFDMPADWDLPEAWWVRVDRVNGGRLGLIAKPDPAKGGERYILSAFEGGPEAVYQHESVTTYVGPQQVVSFA
jgi:hypothetical protein